MSDVKVTKDLEHNKLIIEYVAQGSKDKVWKAYADQALFEQWWGPEGWETTTKEFNFAPGGRVHYGMKCVDEAQGEWYGQTSWGVMEILEVYPTDRFIYKDYFSDENGTLNTEMPALTTTNEFIDEDGATRIICTNVADSADQIEELLKMGMVEGFSGQLKKLDALLHA